MVSNSLSAADLAELQALRTRASIEEAKRLAAESRGDRQAVRDYEIELSRLWPRACDLQRQVA